eukprot:GILK01009152.1.p1 GENE.GILK01009152.1~~GILK01009152.1.p1  ORF type:complete len:304 (-),score=63.74 GILK01009152.1:478-1350(-)
MHETPLDNVSLVDKRCMRLQQQVAVLEKALKLSVRQNGCDAVAFLECLARIRAIEEAVQGDTEVYHRNMVELAKCQKDLQDYRTMLSTFQTVKTVYRQRTAELESNLEAQTQLANQLQHQVDMLQRQVLESQQQRAVDTNRVHADIESQRQVLAERDQQLELLKEEKTSLRKNNERLVALIKQLESERSTLLQQNEQLEEDNLMLRESLEDFKTDFAKTSSHIETLTMQKDVEIDRLKRQCDMYEKERASDQDMLELNALSSQLNMTVTGVPFTSATAGRTKHLPDLDNA